MVNPVSTQITVAAIATQVSSNKLNTSVTFYAKSTNTGIAYIGTSSAVTSSNGYPLEKGTSITFLTGSNSNTNMFWIIGTASDIVGMYGQ